MNPEYATISTANPGFIDQTLMRLDALLGELSLADDRLANLKARLFAPPMPNDTGKDGPNDALADLERIERKIDALFRVSANLHETSTFLNERI